MSFNIPSQPLSAALQAFGLQSGAPIIFDPAAVRGAMSAGVVGRLEPGQALARLLAGTRLNHVTVGGAFTVVANAPAPARSRPPPEADRARGLAPGPRRTAPQAAPPQKDAVSEIVVTGSRVIANGNDSPTPVTVMSVAEMMEMQPDSIVLGLNALPALLGSINSTSNTNVAGPSTVNLRGIGSLRALILFDGHRVGPTQNSGAVSVDAIPQLLLKRVDIVTGGASAVYGSDAVSGVLNFVTDTDFIGVRASLYSGVSQYGDDYRTNAGVAVGREVLGGRGHFVASYETRRSTGALRSDRPFFDTIWTDQGAVVGGGTVGTPDNPYKLTANAVVATVSFGGLVNSGALSGLNFTQNGVLSPFVHGRPTGTSGVEIGGQGAYYTRSTIDLPQDSQRQFARFDYSFPHDVHGFAQLAATQSNYAGVGQNLLLSRATIGYNNAFLGAIQPEYRAMVSQQLAANPLGSFQFSKMDTLYPNSSIRNHESYHMLQTGLAGFAGAFAWDIGYVRTNSEYRTENPNGVDNAHLHAALNAVVNPANGQIVCNAALANPAVYGDCVPLNVFGPTAESAAALAYIRHVPHAAQLYASDDISGSLIGAPLSLPAGEVNMALSAEWRRLTFEVQSDSPPTTPVNCTGIQFGCTATLSPFMGGQTAILAPVTQTVSEVAYEVDAPLLADWPFVRAFNLSAAVRYTNYNTSGSAWTWKLGGVWRIDDRFTVRAARSRDIRAPNLTDLFAPRGVGQSQYVDAHTGASGVVPNINQGNPNLQPEKADTTTAGIVWRPGFDDDFSLSVDAYRIRINDAIVGIGAFQPATQTACEISNGEAEVCSLYVRPLPFSNRTAANYPTALLNQSLNVASLDTYGVDVEVNYATAYFGRMLAVRALFNWQPHLLYDNGPAGKIDVGGAADGIGGLPPIPLMKFVLSGNYHLSDRLTLRLQERWRGPLDQNGSKGLFFADGKVPAIGYTDVAVSYDLNKLVSLSLNIQNLFNTAPPPWASAGGSLQPNYLGGFAQADDIVGRYYTVGLRLRM